MDFRSPFVLIGLLGLFVSIAMGMNKMAPPEIKTYPGFGRECPDGNSDCKFTPKDSSSSVYFSCKNGTVDKSSQFCFCGSGDPPQDELTWPLQWDSDKCYISKGGPCGQDKGLEVICRSGLDCVQGRCRNQTEIRSVSRNSFCNDELDCEQGLKCTESHVPGAVKIKRCY